MMGTSLVDDGERGGDVEGGGEEEEEEEELR